MDKSTNRLNFDALETLLKQEEQTMGEAFCFVGLDRLRYEPRSACKFCQSNLGLLRYELLANDVLVKGICCIRCFPPLLRTMKRYQSDAVRHARTPI